MATTFCRIHHLMTKNIEYQTSETGSQLPEIPQHWIVAGEQVKPRVEEVPRALVIRNVEHQPGYYAPYHSHGRGQLMFISEGLIQVSAKDSGYWVVPPQRAVWIPSYIEHDARTIHSVKMHNVYLAPEVTQELPDQCQVVTVTPLLRELILELSRLPLLYDELGSDGRLVSVFLDQLKATPQAALHLPEPKSGGLKRITQALRSKPENNDSIESWAANAGISSRTLARRFQDETGMTFSQWRQQARLLEALTRIAAGIPIATIAQDLGYSSQSAFIAMFRKALGKTPAKYFDHKR